MTGGAGDRPGLPYLALFAALYAIQGIVIASFFNFNQTYMRAGGVSDPTIGTVSTTVSITARTRGTFCMSAANAI